MTSSRAYFEETVISTGRRGKVRFLFSVDEWLHKGQSEFQEICIFDNGAFGRILALDGIIQLSEIDEFVYHEMLVHPVLLSHPDPRQILIIGGGDGGSLRECLKHAPAEVVMVEIDPQVIELSKRFLPFTAADVFEDERLHLVLGDGSSVIREHTGRFDAVIVDSGDDVGPSSPLYEESFYADVSRALKPGGVASFQVGSFLEPEFVRTIARRLKNVFRFHTVYRLTMPVYNDGDYSMMAASQGVDLAGLPLEVAQRRVSRIEGHERLRYYTPAMHKASQVLPPVYSLD